MHSRHINTVCWILELFYMMSWKYSPKEVLNNNELSKELHTQIKNILATLAELCVNKQKFATVASDSKASFIVNTQETSDLSITLPFTPVVFELYQGYSETTNGIGEKTEDIRDLYWIQRTLFDPYKQKGDQLTVEDYGRKCSLIAFKTLKKIAFITLINTYEASKIDRVIENVYYHSSINQTKVLMSTIFPLMEDKENIIIVEASSELLHALLKNSRDQLPKEFKKQILDIFNGTVIMFMRYNRISLNVLDEL